jgi:hypothetical protein
MEKQTLTATVSGSINFKKKAGDALMNRLEADTIIDDYFRRNEADSHIIMIRELGTTHLMQDNEKNIFAVCIMSDGPAFYINKK